MCFCSGGGVVEEVSLLEALVAVVMKMTEETPGRRQS